MNTTAENANATLAKSTRAALGDSKSVGCLGEGSLFEIDQAQELGTAHWQRCNQTLGAPALEDCHLIRRSWQVGKRVLIVVSHVSDQRCRAPTLSIAGQIAEHLSWHPGTRPDSVGEMSSNSKPCEDLERNAPVAFETFGGLAKGNGRNRDELVEFDRPAGKIPGALGFLVGERQVVVDADSIDNGLGRAVHGR